MQIDSPKYPKLIIRRTYKARLFRMAKAGVVVALALLGLCFFSGWKMGYSTGYREGQESQVVETKNTEAVDVFAEQTDAHAEEMDMHIEEELHGVDISKYQGKNFVQVISSEQASDFVICRATENKLVDGTCDKAYQYAKSQGKLLGVYFWCDPTILDARDYAAFCVKTVQGYIGEAVFVLDFEHRHKRLDPEWAKEWLEEFEKLSGVKPLIYMNSSTARELDWSPVIAGGYKLWVASYGVDDGKNHGLPDRIGQWPDSLVVMHQYTTCGLGKRETLDLDVFFGSREDWVQLAARDVA